MCVCVKGSRFSFFFTAEPTSGVAWRARDEQDWEKICPAATAYNTPDTLPPRKVSDADRLFGTPPEIYKNKMPTASVFRNRTVFFFFFFSSNIITGRFHERQFFFLGFYLRYTIDGQ